jgi:hypothetical protein
MECQPAVRVAIVRLRLLARPRRRGCSAEAGSKSGADDMTDSSTAPGGALSAESAEAAGSDGASGGADGRRASGVAGEDSMSDSDSRIASIDVPSGNVKVDEDYRPQTLGGLLPLVIGVNEEGRFDFDQYALREEVKHALDELAVELKTAEFDRLDIVGTPTASAPPTTTSASRSCVHGRLPSI